jgi:hypothetical protein
MSKNNTFGWNYGLTPGADTYLDKCTWFAENDDAFANFRQDPDYKRVLEAGEYIVGRMHLDRMKIKYDLNFLLDHIDGFRENDLYGNATILNFPEVEHINPCTIMYVSQLLDIKTMLGDYVPKKIVEIGGGFGGMCKVIDAVYDFDEYVLIDLAPAIALCKKYLSNFPDLYSRVTFITCEEFEKIDSIQDVDLFIAVASMSECNEVTQTAYIDKILLNSKHAYIIYNTCHLTESKNMLFRWKERIAIKFSGFSEQMGDVQIICLNKVE